jgi:hypothetical protein
MNDDRPYEILGPGHIRLSPTAREWAREHGMSENEMARHLLRQHELRERGFVNGKADG